MPPAKPALQREPGTDAESQFASHEGADPAPVPRRSNNEAASVTPIRPVSTARAQAQKEISFQPRVPVIIGEATYRGSMPVDGIISGQLGATGSAVTVKQRPKNGAPDLRPELEGELTFKDMLRINGHVAGKIFSYHGTLIVDGSARVDAAINVGVCIVRGTVNGDVVAQERVELGPAAVINGDICTASLAMKPGAIFTGNCRMLKNNEGDG